MNKKLLRSRENRMIAGVLGGIAEHFNTDPVLIRFGYLALTLITGVGPGIILYIIAAVVIPEAPAMTPSTPVTSVDDTSAV